MFLQHRALDRHTTKCGKCATCLMQVNYKIEDYLIDKIKRYYKGEVTY